MKRQLAGASGQTGPSAWSSVSPDKQRCLRQGLHSKDLYGLANIAFGIETAIKLSDERSQPGVLVQGSRNGNSPGASDQIGPSGGPPYLPIKQICLQQDLRSTQQGIVRLGTYCLQNRNRHKTLRQAMRNRSSGAGPMKWQLAWGF